MDRAADNYAGGISEFAVQVLRRAGGNTPVPEVARLLDRSCSDCHSQNTVWPWYSEVAPVSWVVIDDVQQGRRHLNLSDWAKYPPGGERDQLPQVCTEVKKGGMPPREYLWVHRDKRLTPEERAVICDWTGAERQPSGVLPPAPDRPDQRESRHVRTGDEKHKPNGGEKRQERRSQSADDILLHGNDIHTIVGIVCGVLLFEAARGYIHVPLGLVNLNAGFKAGNRAQVSRRPHFVVVIFPYGPVNLCGRSQKQAEGKRAES